MTDSPTRLNIRIWLDGTGEPIDVQTRFIDNRNYERTAFKHKWPPFQESPMTWLGFLAWSAAKRTGQYEGTWETFENEVAHVETVDTETVNPTDPEPGEGSYAN